MTDFRRYKQLDAGECGHVKESELKEGKKKMLFNNSARDKFKSLPATITWSTNSKPCAIEGVVFPAKRSGKLNPGRTPPKAPGTCLRYRPSFKGQRQTAPIMVRSSMEQGLSDTSDCSRSSSSHVAMQVLSPGNQFGLQSIPLLRLGIDDSWHCREPAVSKPIFNQNIRHCRRSLLSSSN